MKIWPARDWWTFALAAVVAGGGFAVLLGWFLDVSLLKSGIPGGAVMRPSAALCFVIAGIGLMLLAGSAKGAPNPRLIAGQVCNAVVGGTGLAMLAEYSHRDLATDALLFPQAFAGLDTLQPGRMSPATAGSFVLVAVGAVLLDVRSRRGRFASQMLVLAAMLIAATALLGYVYGTPTLYRFAPFAPMALHTAVLLVVLGTALLLARPGQGIVATVASRDAGGLMARAVLPLALGLPIVLGWVSLAGDRAGWYGTETAVALFAVANIVCFTAVVMFAARSLNRAAAERRKTEEHAVRLAQSIDQWAEAVISLDADARIVGWSAAAVRLFGYQPHEAAGRLVAELLVPASRPGERADVQRRMRSDAGAVFETWFAAKTGALIDVEISVAPIHDDSGRLIGQISICRDIRERRRAEQAVRDSERRFRELAESLPQLVWTGADDGSCDFFSRQWSEYTGAAERAGSGWLQQVHPDDRAAAGAAWRAAVAAGANFHTELRIRRDDGAYRWFDARAVPVRDDEGHIVKWCGSNTEIHAAREMREALRQQAMLIDLTYDPIFVADENEGIVLWNRGCERVYGYRAEEALGKASRELLKTVLPVSRAEFSEALTRNAQWEGELRHTSKAGGEVVVFGRLQTVEIGGRMLVLEADRDMTERKRAEEQMRSMVDAIPIAMIMSDRAGRIVQVNKHAEDLFGYSSAELLAMDVEQLVPARFRHHQHSRQQYFGAPAKRSMGVGRDLVGLKKDGTEVSIEIGLNPIMTDAGTLVLASIADISARKQAEDSQRRQERIEALGTLAGGIAHDFNNILMAITGNTRLAMADLPVASPVRESLTEIAKASARATDLVRRILTFGRQQEPKRECVQLRPVIDETLKLLRSILPGMIDIRAKFADDLPEVAVDASQVHQAIANLATNAAHAIGARPGNIDLRVEAVVVSLEFARMSPDLRVGRYVRLSMSDDGNGMDAATLERIFDPFFTTKPVGQGAGLGLSVVHGIMKRHGGAVTAYSALGKGSTFRLYFPVASADLPVETPTHQEPIRRGHGERLLYVDDDEALVFLQMRMLGRMSYEVAGYTNAEAALEAFRADPDAFDAVITDWTMPRMSGVELAGELLKIRPDIPIIMTSGYVRPEDVEAVKRLGVIDLMLKPNTLDELSKVLDELLDARAAARGRGDARNGVTPPIRS